MQIIYIISKMGSLILLGACGCGAMCLDSYLLRASSPASEQYYWISRSYGEHT